MSSVFRLPVGPDSEIEKGSLAGAAHPKTLSCLWQHPVWSTAAQFASFYTTSSHWRFSVPYASGHLQNVWLHRWPWGMWPTKHSCQRACVALSLWFNLVWICLWYILIFCCLFTMINSNEVNSLIQWS